MAPVAIVTDSTAYLPEELVKKYHLTILPQLLIWGEETLEDGVDIQPEEFYNRLKTAKQMPTTSQVTPAAMQKAFTRLLEEGYDVLGIFISSKLSGTIQSALQARDALNSGKDKVEIVDSQSTAMAMGFHVLSAARAAAEGASLAECKAIAEKARQHTGVYFVVDTLEFLHRGGRIGGAQRFLGSALNLKPLLAIIDGRVEAVERIRTKRKALKRLLEVIGEHVEGKSPVRLATLHANAPQEARELLDKASEMFNPVESIFSEVSPVIGTHAGPGTVGLAYMVGM
ncbi:MAG: DegV family protein [Anaerolineae bacterium]|nr:MAG: DegV family protein [Anaerolineae bacterium]